MSPCLGGSAGEVAGEEVGAELVVSAGAAGGSPAARPFEAVADVDSDSSSFPEKDPL